MTVIRKKRYLLPYTWQEPANPLGRPSATAVAYVVDGHHYVLTREEFRNDAKLAVIFQLPIAEVIAATSLSHEACFQMWHRDTVQPPWLDDVGPFVEIAR